MVENDKLQTVFRIIENSRDEIVDLQKVLTSCQAMSPESGGTGEYEKAEALKTWLSDRGFRDIENRDALDHRVPSGRRSNVIVSLSVPGSGSSFWIMSHLDVVPPGELSNWVSDPFTLRVEDDRLYGRGTEDNQQSLVSSVIAAKALISSGLKPSRDIKLLFVADEETGSEYGIQHLINEPGLFRDGDVFLVPDAGNAEGTMIETAEKNVLWLKFTVRGKQVHASTPDHGVNAFVAGSALVVRLSRLNEHFRREDELFSPPASTFSPTKKDRNVPNINTIPGEDVFYMDCRIIPALDADAVMEQIGKEEREVENRYGVKISHKVMQRVESKPTRPDSEIVKALRESLRIHRQAEGKPTGIGGGTVAAYLRNKGFDTVVWSTIDGSAHQENEYSRIRNCILDAKIMADLMLRF
ncbi:MAG: M20 family metallo-hydrolase [Spirochaetia bacterium]